jgi:hypothetical protein
VEQELLTLLQQLSSPPVFSGVHVIRSLVLCVYFVDLCLFLAIVVSCQILITPLVIFNLFLALVKLMRLYHAALADFVHLF